MISGVNIRTWWLCSIRNASGHEARSQQRCSLGGEIKITPAVTSTLQFLHWNERILVQEYSKAKPIEQKMFWDLACCRETKMVNQYSFFNHEQYSRVNHLSPSWSCGTDFPLHLSDYIPIDIPQHSGTSISQTDSCFSNGSLILEKLKWGYGSLIVKQGECMTARFPVGLHPLGMQLSRNYLWWEQERDVL